MRLDWSQGELAEGLRCYRSEEFFEAHEHWECVWLGLPEPEKTFLQALIQIAAAFHHLKRGNPLGTVSLLNGAVRRLQRYPEEYGGIRVADLLLEVEVWIRTLQREEDVAGLASPRFCLSEPAGGRKDYECC